MVRKARARRRHARTLGLFLASALALAEGCGGGIEGGLSVPAGEPWSIPERPLCEHGYLGFPLETGRLEDEALVETSGIASSWWRTDVLYVHNDSGDSARVFAIGVAGETLAELDLDGVSATDIEDIAVAACPPDDTALTAPCLYLADVGDNGGPRDDKAIYVVEEPLLEPAAPLGKVTVAVRRVLPVVLPESPLDIEGLAASPDGQTLFLFEKRDTETFRVFALDVPDDPDEIPAVSALAEVPSPGIGAVPLGRMITGADLHPSGERLVLRTYVGVHEYVLEGPSALASLAIVPPTLVALGPLSEPQGEAVAYDGTGSGLFTVSEDPDGAPHQPLHHYPCN